MENAIKSNQGGSIDVKNAVASTNSQAEVQNYGKQNLMDSYHNHKGLHSLVHVYYVSIKKLTIRLSKLFSTNDSVIAQSSWMTT